MLWFPVWMSGGGLKVKSPTSSTQDDHCDKKQSSSSKLLAKIKSDPLGVFVGVGVLVGVAVGGVDPIWHFPQAVPQRPSSPLMIVPRASANSLNAQNELSSAGSSDLPL